MISEILCSQTIIETNRRHFFEGTQFFVRKMFNAISYPHFFFSKLARSHNRFDPYKEQDRLKFKSEYGLFSRWSYIFFKIFECHVQYPKKLKYSLIKAVFFSYNGIQKKPLLWYVVSKIYKKFSISNKDMQDFKLAQWYFITSQFKSLICHSCFISKLYLCERIAPSGDSTHREWLLLKF